MQQAQEFMSLFKGMHRAYGTYEITTTKSDGVKLVGNEKTIKTIRGDVTDVLWKGHLDGVKGIGIVPITDNSTCYFGAIDIDVYDLDLLEVVKKIHKEKLPLVPCRSKSGGLHCFIFLKDEVLAKDLQDKLKEFAAIIGYGNAEIFPKQVRILAERGDVGQWINMPYFEGDKTTRYCIKLDGTGMTVSEFLEYATGLRIEPKDLFSIKIKQDEEFKDGPPCLQCLATEGFPSGTRNDGMFNFLVYLKKAFQHDWQNKVGIYNKKFMVPPLTQDEIGGIVKSTARKEYNYTCSKPPIKNHCNLGLCRTRKHGVGQVTGIPALSGLTKYDTNPPLWFVDIEGGGRMELTTEDLQNQQRFQKRCIEVLNKMPPPIKPSVWQTIIQELLEKVTTIEAPLDASPSGQLMDFLERFCTSKAQAKAKDELLLGKPWLDDGRHYFRLSDFMTYLDRNHFRDFNLARIASIIREKGGTHHFFKLKGKSVNCWSFPAFMIQTEGHETPKYDDKDHF